MVMNVALRREPQASVMSHVTWETEASLGYTMRFTQREREGGLDPGYGACGIHPEADGHAI